MKKYFSLVALAAMALFVSATPASAALITFTNLASFQAAAGATTLENFSTATLGFSTANYGPVSFNGFTLSSVSNGDRTGIATGSMASLGDNNAIPAPLAGQNFYGWGNDDGNLGPTTTFNFGGPVTAFGFDWFNTDETNTYRLTVNGQNFVSPPFTDAPFSGGASPGFFGIVAIGGETFSLATIQAEQSVGYVSTGGLDNVRVAAVGAPVPEPATLSLLGLGLVGAAVVRYRRRR